ncbi:MAG: hypothetical protein ABGY41_11300, partial [Candidatus Poribacteria bacterium]
MKVCSGCGQEKPLAHVNGSSKTADGKAPRCRACVTARRRELARLGGAKVKPPLKARPAAKKGDIDALKVALKLAPETDPTLLLSTAVAWATESKAERYAEVVRLLIDFGADPGGRGALGMPMPALAARSGVPQLVRLLRDAGAE